MKYQPLLSEVKKFLIDTRMIELCNGQCKGCCCGGIKCQSLDDCNNRLACKIHICKPLLDHLFCGKDADDYQRMIDYTDDEINKRFMITNKRAREADGSLYVYRAWLPYNKEMDKIEFDDIKIKSIFKIDRVKIAKKIEFLLLNTDNLQCSKTDMDDQCEQCTKFFQCAFYLMKRERIKELTGQKSLLDNF